MAKEWQNVAELNRPRDNLNSGPQVQHVVHLPTNLMYQSVSGYDQLIITDYFFGQGITTVFTKSR